MNFKIETNRYLPLTVKVGVNNAARISLTNSPPTVSLQPFSKIITSTLKVKKDFLSITQFDRVLSAKWYKHLFQRPSTNTFVSVRITPDIEFRF